MQNLEWLYQNIFTYNEDKVLKHSLYYPCCGSDIDPINNFIDNVYSFIYVDQDESVERIPDTLNDLGGDNYHVIHSVPISRQELIPRNQKRILPPDKYHNNNCTGEWRIFERDENPDGFIPKRFSLLNLYADGVYAYESLYLFNKIAPKIISIIQHGKFERFIDRNGPFAEVAFHNNDLLPEYLLYGGVGEKHFYECEEWPEYAEHVCWLSRSKGGNIKLLKFSGPIPADPDRLTAERIME